MNDQTTKHQLERLQQIESAARRLMDVYAEFDNDTVIDQKLWDGLNDALTLTEHSAISLPRIVCLCGSTRFWRDFQRASLSETMAGRIVLSIGAASGTDDEHFGNLPREEYDRIKAELDELHKRKIDLADEILVLNVDGYIGESTRSEIEYAKEHGKAVRWLEPLRVLMLQSHENPYND